MGYEANYAGTSFVAPPEKMIGKLKYGPDFMNIQADRTQEGSLARVAWDDEGVPADKWLIIEKGMFKDYQTTREQAAWIQKLTGVDASHGCSFADSWDARAVPAHAEHLAAAGRTRHQPRRHHRRHRSRHRRQEPRLVVDRSPALQLPVLRPGVLRGAGRQDRRHAQGRRLPGHTPVFWNSMDMIGGPVVVLARRLVRRRQGRAVAVELGEPRLRAGALPQRQHHQHEEDGMIAQALPARTLADAELLSREQAKALADRVLAFATPTRRASTSTSGWAGNTRFAGNEITTSAAASTDTSRHGDRHDRQAPRVGVDQRARRRIAQAHGRSRRVDSRGCRPKIRS